MAGDAITREQTKAIIKPYGYVEYNGFVFNELVKTKLEITPVENHARTGSKYEEYLFTIESLITPEDIRAQRLSIDYDTQEHYTDTNGITSYVDPYGPSTPLKNRTGPTDTTDPTFRLLRRVLSRAGGVFVYGYKGAGEDLIFSNRDDYYTRQDICFGPMPKLISFEPVAGNKMARVVFQVLVRFKSGCTTPKSYGVVDFNVTTAIKTNGSGYKQIIRKGYLEVSLPRITSTQNAKSINPSDDVRYNETWRIEEQYKIVLDRLIGINMQGYRVEHEIDFSPDHRSCNFSIRYSEIESPNAYPNGVVKINATHRAASSLLGDEGKLAASNYSKWLNEMSASITLRPNIPPIKAWFIFTEILNERLAYSTVIEEDFFGVLRAKIPMILDIEMEESLFSHEYNFKVTWVTWLGNLSEMLNKTGMFKPLESTNWFDWTTDVRTVNGIHGAYPLVPGKHGSTAFEVTLCNSNLYGPDRYIIDLETTRGLPEEFVFQLFGTECPPPSSSFLDYQEKFYVVSQGGKLTYQRYKNPNDSSSRDYTSSVSDEPQLERGFDMLDYYRDSPEEEYYRQDFNKDQFKLIVRGYAIRLGGPTSPAAHKEIGGKKVELIPGADIISNQIKSASGNCPIVITTWERHYRILGKPADDMSRSNKGTGDPRKHQ
jgi:hypothetical protein